MLDVKQKSYWAITQGETVLGLYSTKAAAENALAGMVAWGKHVPPLVIVKVQA